MKVLITGIPGWLGNRLLELLLQEKWGDGLTKDWRIRCLVEKGADLSFVRNLSRERPIECLWGDVRRKQTLKDTLRGADLVLHLAGVIHPRRIRDFYEVNTQGTENLLQVAWENGVKRFVFVSSNSACGVNPHRGELMTEETPPRPYLSYGVSKYQAECAVRRFQEAKKLETVILRPCWYYGPRQPLRQTTFFRMIRKGNQVLFGDGESLRSMTYLDNMCEALLLAALEKKANGQTYWIADERPYRVSEIYSTIAELLGVSTLKPLRIPGIISEACLFADKLSQKLGLYFQKIHVAGEMNKNIACSIEKAKSQLGYHPRVELREGMKRSIDWCRANGIRI